MVTGSYQLGSSTWTTASRNCRRCDCMVHKNIDYQVKAGSAHQSCLLVWDQEPILPAKLQSVTSRSDFTARKMRANCLKPIGPGLLGSNEASRFEMMVPGRSRGRISQWHNDKAGTTRASTRDWSCTASTSSTSWYSLDVKTTKSGSPYSVARTKHHMQEAGGVGQRSHQHWVNIIWFMINAVDFVPSVYPRPKRRDSHRRLSHSAWQEACDAQMLQSLLGKVQHHSSQQIIRV